jgi:hypothetical protein
MANPESKDIPKTTSKRKPKPAKKPKQKTEAKVGKGGKRGKAKSREVVEDSTEDTASDSGNDVEEVVERAPPRKLPQRKAAAKRVTQTKVLSDLSESGMDEDAWVPPKTGQKSVGQPASEPSTHASPYFQISTMAQGTLPMEWRQVSFNAPQVSTRHSPGLAFSVTLGNCHV